VFALTAALAHGAGLSTELPSPGLGQVVSVALVGGVIATVIAVLVAYYGTIAAVRRGLDPDTYGIPLVTSTLDLAGAFTLVLSVRWLGVI
jgi:mgtE-like transporter